LITTEKSKVKSVRASSDTVSRVKIIFAGVNMFVDIIKKRYDGYVVLIVAETPSGSQSASGMKNYGIACALIASLNAYEVTPIEVKKHSVGSKTASKRDMINWAAHKHPEVDWPMRGGNIQNKAEHIADAVAVVYTFMAISKEFTTLTQLIK
jgi:Holliday junction resolvasome RuvABC endonuclease subunit